MKRKLSLRDLCWLLVVVGCLCGWWRERQKVLAEQQTNVKLTNEREIWRGHARAAQALLSQQGVRIKFYELGYSLERSAVLDVHINDNDAFFGFTPVGPELAGPEW